MPANDPFRSLLAALLLSALMAIVTLPIAWGWHIWTDPGFHQWPAITRCRPCGHRIFAWQRYSRRPYAVRLGNPDNLAVSVSMSGMVHDGCEGVPAIDVSVKRGDP